MDDVTPLAVNERVAARMLSVSVAALRRWRREKRGPKFVRLSRCIRYCLGDLQTFLVENTEGKSVQENGAGHEREQSLI